jgi:hypothetical protein
MGTNTAKLTFFHLIDYNKAKLVKPVHIHSPLHRRRSSSAMPVLRNYSLVQYELPLGGGENA